MGVPQWTVRVMSVVPSLIVVRDKMSHLKRQWGEPALWKAECVLTHRYWPPESTRYISSTVSLRAASLVGLQQHKQEIKQRCNDALIQRVIYVLVLTSLKYASNLQTDSWSPGVCCCCCCEHNQTLPVMCKCSVRSTCRDSLEAWASAVNLFAVMMFTLTVKSNRGVN